MIRRVRPPGRNAAACGKDYELPAGFEVAETNDGTPAIYKGNDHYDLYKQFNSPAITNGFETHMLKLVK